MCNFYLFFTINPRAFGNIGGAAPPAAAVADEIGVLRPAELPADPKLPTGLPGETVALPCALRARAFFDVVLVDSRLKFDEERFGAGIFVTSITTF